MNILIVDDKPVRYQNLIPKLEKGPLKDGGLIRWAASVGEALDRLAENQFDIVIVDMLLPLTNWTNPVHDGGVQLIQNLDEDDSLLKPHHIVGITAAADDAKEVQEAFSANHFLLLRDLPGLPSWESRLESLIQHVVDIESQERKVTYETDVCIITALRSEYDAVLATISGWSDPFLIDSGTYVQKATISSEGKLLSIVAAYSSRMGAVEAALLSTKLINKFRPRLLAMTGICAGFESKTNYGDVLVASPVWEYMQSSKITVDETGTRRVEYGPDYIPVDGDISARFDRLNSDTRFLFEMHQACKSEKPLAPPRVFVKPAATGPAVIADGETLKKIREEQNRDALGLEMEAYGVYCSARSASRPRPLVFSAKAVCDFGNYFKNDKYQAYAAYCSATVVTEFLKRYGKELVLSIGNA